MIKDKMPLPLIGEVIDKLKEVRYFNKLDLIWGYNNVRIKEGDEWKTVFLTNKGLFEPQVMYFGLCNSPGTFQRMMNSIFRELLHEGVLANYIDDFVIPAKTMKELEERTIRFLKIAEKHNLCFKRSKCDFNMEEIPILEVVVGKGQIQMEQEKIKAVKEWKTPTRVKDVESFLGFANFYQRFIQNFSHTAKPLNELKGKKEWKWEEEHQREDHKSTSIGITEERRKIQSGNRCFRTCYRRSTIPRARREMETHHFPIKNNVTSRAKLRDLRQGTISNSRSSHKMETISIGCSRTL